jgi:hypothetical protein
MRISRKPWLLPVVGMALLLTLSLVLLAGSYLPAGAASIPNPPPASENRHPELTLGTRHGHTLMATGGNAYLDAHGYGPPPGLDQTAAAPAALQPQGVISPTSIFVLYHREDDNSIWLKEEMSHSQIMTGAHPSLSPDGRYIVYQSTIWYGDIYVRDLETGLDTLVYNASDITVGASWTADGSRILFDHGCYIYSVDPNGSNLQTIIGAWPGSYYCWNDNPDSSPVDGRIAWENGHYGLGLADADGANPHWIPNTQQDDYSPRWSPDGQWIAFWRGDNVYKIRPDGSDLTPLTFLTENVNWMEDTGQWTSDGKYLVAAAQVDGVEGLYAAATDGSGILVLLVLRDWVEPDWVGSVGHVEIHRLYLPLVARKG